MSKYIELVEATAYKTLYHVAKTSIVNKIKKEGIVPQKKPSWTGAMGQDIRDCKECVYAFTDFNEAARWAFKAEWDNKPEKFSIITFDGGGLNWEKDTHIQSQMAMGGNWLRVKGEVSPDKIKKVESMSSKIAKSLVV